MRPFVLVYTYQIYDLLDDSRGVIGFEAGLEEGKVANNLAEVFGINFVLSRRAGGSCGGFPVTGGCGERHTDSWRGLGFPYSGVSEPFQ